MIKERRYETYGGKDGTIDMENKKMVVHLISGLI